MSIWMLLESTEQRLPQLFRQVGAPELSLLFDSTELAPYHMQSPILVKADDRSGLLEAAQQTPEVWPGLIVQSEHPEEAVLAHLRQILLVRFEGNRRGVLRYSNPTTASYFFPACQTDQLKLWLGPVSHLSWYGGTWADRALGHVRWQGLEKPDAINWKASVHESVLEANQQLALQAQLQDHFLYRWWLKQNGLCYSRCRQWLGEGLHQGFTSAASLECYLAMRQVYPEGQLPVVSPTGPEQKRLNDLLIHLQQIPAGQES